MPRSIIPFPTELRPQLPTIVGNVDYLTLQLRLQQIDALLQESGIEKQFVELALERWVPSGKKQPSAQQQQRFQERSRRALRSTILRTLLQEDYRGFSCQLAGNPLYQWFCRPQLSNSRDFRSVRAGRCGLRFCERCCRKTIEDSVAN